MDDTFYIAELDPYRFPCAVLKIYLNQDMTRRFWRPPLCLGSSWEFTSFPPPRLGAVTYPARLARHLFQPLPGRFHQCFRRRRWRQPEGSACRAAGVNASSTDLGCWDILRYLRYFQIGSGVGRDFSFGSLNSSENLETVAVFPGLHSVRTLKVNCVRSLLLDCCLRRKSLLWRGLRYCFPRQTRPSSDSWPHHS